MKRLALSTVAVVFSWQANAADDMMALPSSYPSNPPLDAVANPFSGHLEAFVGPAFAEGDTAWTLGGTGRLNYNFDQRWNIQGDLFADGTWYDSADLFTYGVSTHAYWRDSGSFAVGAFGTFRAFDGGLPGVRIEDQHEYLFGPEGQLYFGDLTLYAQGYYGKGRVGGYGSTTILGVRGVARYFLQDNLRFDAEVGFRGDSVDEDAIIISTETLSIAAQANYRFDGTPLTLFGRYQFDNVSRDVELRTDHAGVHRIMAGVRYSFGNSSLFEEDRYGATMETPPVN